LLEFAGAIQRKVREVNAASLDSRSPSIRFVRAGGTPSRGSPRKDFGILHEGRDWICDFDLPELHSTTTYQFPADVDATSLVCDGYILSRSRRICIILELTVPMEENIEYWHQTKLGKYGELQSQGWTLHHLVIEVGCRGFVPPRFSGICRQLGFDSAGFKRMRDNLQLVARKCSYVIWLNRFNKDFNSSFRISVDGLSTQGDAVLTKQVSQLSHAEKARITGNREAALLRLRESRNRKTALLRLRTSKFKYKPVNRGVDSTATATHMEGRSTVQKLTPTKRVRFASPLVVGPSASTATTTTTEEKGEVSSPRWTLLELPGLSLRNSQNKCWFHAALHFLTAIPMLRSRCLSSTHGLSMFEKRFFGAIRGIFSTRSRNEVDRFFPLVRDFDGVNRRYGQVAVPDFIEYLCSHSVNLSPLVTFTVSTQLQCSKCLWISQRSSKDVSLKLHLPPGGLDFTLADLADYNSRVVLTDNDAVFCARCNIKAPHTLSREYNPDLFLVEVIRATESSRNTWLKNNASLNFPVTSLKLPGFPRTYRVASTCHHRGSVNSGHWLTKISTNTGWYELDDLVSRNLRTSPPGVNDTSVAIILLIAEDKLI
jgi:hypothetical protein